jgi:hypothetical protein
MPFPCRCVETAHLLVVQNQIVRNEDASVAHLKERQFRSSPFFIPNLNKSSAAVWVISSTGCSEEGPIHIEWNSEWPDGVTNGIAHLFCGRHNIDALPISLRPTVYACGLLLFLVFDDRNTQFICFFQF